MPVLLGSGIPLLPPGADAKLVLTDLKRLPTSGTVVLAYTVEGSRAAAPQIAYVKPPGNSKKKRATTGKSRQAKKRVEKPRRRSSR